MPSIAFAARVIPGKSDQLREALRSHAPGGERRAAYEASRERHGISREMSWLQQTPAGDLAVVYIEAEDLHTVFSGLAGSQDPFDVWFREQTREVHGIDLEDGMPAPEQLLQFDAGLRTAS